MAVRSVLLKHLRVPLVGSSVLLSPATRVSLGGLLRSENWFSSEKVDDRVNTVVNNCQKVKPPKEMPKLYSYWRSSCSHRVRIALNLKGLDYEYKAVNLLKHENEDPEFVKINPLKYVPTLVDGDLVVSDSFAIILYLEDKYPIYPLLPRDLKKKALNIQVASIVSSSIQPLQNLGVLSYIEEKVNADEKTAWAQRQINKGFTAIEKLLKDSAGKCATGDEAQLADVFLAPQIFGGIARFNVDMSQYPTLSRLNETYNELPAFQAALPDRQPDAPSSS